MSAKVTQKKRFVAVAPSSRNRQTWTGWPELWTAFPATAFPVCPRLPSTSGNFFTSSVNLARNKLERLTLANFFNPNLIFVTRAGHLTLLYARVSLLGILV